MYTICLTTNISLLQNKYRYINPIPLNNLFNWLQANQLIVKSETFLLQSTFWCSWLGYCLQRQHLIQALTQAVTVAAHGKAWENGVRARAPISHTSPEWDSRTFTSTWPDPNCCSHWGSETGHGRSLCNFILEMNKNSLKNKIK